MTSAPKGTGTKEKAHSGLYTFALYLFSALYATLMPVKYHGRENMNLEAPFLVISNHLSLMDPITVAVPCKRHQIHFLGKKELGKNKVIRWLFQKLHYISIDRGATDMEAMRACLNALKKGSVLGVFPEGTRSAHGIMEEIQSGIAVIALRSGVPIIPVYIPRKPKWFRLTHVVIGQPIPTDDLPGDGVSKERCEALIQRMTELYREMQKEYPTEKKW